MGTVTGLFSGRPNHRIRLETQLASQSITGNYSTINWQLYIDRLDAYGSWDLNSGGSRSVSIGSNVWNGGAFTYDTRSSATIGLGSGTYNVGHNADGTGAYNFSTSVSAIGPLGSASAGGTEGLPTIPRATTPTVSPTSGNTGSTYTINHTPASSSFVHDIFYSLNGGTNYTLIASDVPGTDHSTAWTPAHSLLPNSTSVTAIILLRTKASAGGTIIGDKTVNLPLTVPSSVIPTISSVSWADSQTSAPDIPTLMGGTGRYVQRWSKLKPTVTSSGASGSTVTSSNVTQSGQTVPSGTTFPSAVSLSGNVPYSATAQDSRGRTSATYTNTVPVTAYNYPNLPTPLVQRTSDAAGNTPSPTGTYLAITPLASVSSLLFGGVQKNLLEWQVRTKPVGGSYTTKQAWTSNTVSGTTWTTKYVAGGGYASSSEYVVEVSIRDLFGKNGYNTAQTVVVLEIPVRSEAVFLDFDGTNGIGVGKYRSLGMVDVAGQMYQNGGQQVMDPANFGTIVNQWADTSKYVADANLQVYAGEYQLTPSSIHGPVASAYYLLSVRNGYGRSFQTASLHDGTNVYVRGMTNTDFVNPVWSAWTRRYSTASEVNSLLPAALPDPIRTGSTTAQNVISAASFANLPNRCYVDITLAAKCWVQIDGFGWMSIGAAGAETRMSSIVSGATTLNAIPPSGGLASWAQVAILQTPSTVLSLSTHRLELLNAGANHIELQAYVHNANGGCSYNGLTVTPIRWD